MKTSKYNGILLAVAVAIYFASGIVEKPLSFFDYLLIVLGSISYYAVFTVLMIKNSLAVTKKSAKKTVIITTVFFFVLEIIEKIVYTIDNPSSVRIKLFPPFLPGLILVIYICDLKGKGQSLKTPKRIIAITVLALITAWFLGSDFSNRTIHHEITLGYSRWSVLLVRELPVLLSGVILHFVYVFSVVLGVACKNGFSGAMFETADILWCITIMLQLMGLQSVITMITFICAKAPAAIAISVSFTIIACNVLRNFLGGTFFTKTVFYLARDNASATLLPTSIVAVVTLIVFITLTYMIFRRKEIK